jgi:hypothetical protein
MSVLALGDYVPIADLARILLVALVALVAAVAAPSAAALVAIGLERRQNGAVVRGTAVVAVGALGLALLASAGLYALVQR